MIEVHEVEKRYGEVQALAGVSFTVQPGEVFGLLGHNGAGKSSVIGMLTGLFQATAGTIEVWCVLSSVRKYLSSQTLVLQGTRSRD